MGFVFGVFIGSLATTIYMAIFKSGSDADDIMMGDKQYDDK